MIESTALTALRDAKANYDSAVKANMNVAAKKQTLLNILLSHADELIESALDAEYLLKKKIENEKEIASLKKQIADLTSDPAEAECDKPTPKKKNR